MVTISYKNETILQNCCFCKIFAFTSEAQITEKFTLPKHFVIFSELTTNTSKTNCHFFPKLTTKLTPFPPKIAQFLQIIYTKCIVEYIIKMTLLPKVSLHKITF